MFKSFDAEMSVSGRPIMVLPNGEIGTRWDNGAPTRFRFDFLDGQCTIKVAGQDSWVGCDKEGFLVLQSTPVYFHLFNAEDGLGWYGTNTGAAVIKLITATGDRVLLFGGDDSFEDPDTLYNFLIAAKPKKVVAYWGEVQYLVPNGDGHWVEHSESKPYRPEPVSIALSLDNVEVSIESLPPINP